MVSPCGSPPLCSPVKKRFCSACSVDHVVAALVENQPLGGCKAPAPPAAPTCLLCSTSKGCASGDSASGQQDNTPPHQRKPVKATAQGLSELSRQLFAPPSSPPPLSPQKRPRSVLKHGVLGTTASDFRIRCDCVEARQLDELCGLHIPLLDMRLVNAILNKRMQSLRRKHDMRVLQLLMTYTKRLARYNPKKWGGLSERYEARLNNLMAAWSRAHC